MSAAERDPAATERRARLADLLARQAAVRSAALRPSFAHPALPRPPFGSRAGFIRARAAVFFAKAFPGLPGLQ